MPARAAFFALLLLALSLAGCSGDKSGDEVCTIEECPPGSSSPTVSSDTASSSTPTNPTSSSASSTAPPGPQPTQCPSAPCTINIQGSTFVDGSIVVKVGDTVRWVQKDNSPHTVTADDASFTSGNLLPAPTQDTFEHAFTAAGSVPYHCANHPGMKATITVVA